MDERHIYGKTSDEVIYKESDGSCELFVVFDLVLKAVRVSTSIWVSNGRDSSEASEVTKHSARYGHWQAISPQLSLSDINFISNKANELFT